MQLRQSLSSLRRWGAGLGVGLLAFALILTGCDSDSGMDDPPEPEPATTITDVVTSTDDLSTLADVLSDDQAEALDDTSTTFTVFAPSNTAFEPYDFSGREGLVAPVVNYHVVQGAAVTSDQLSDGDTFTTLQGDQIEVTLEDGNVFVEGAQVTTPDVEADNGVAHVIDDVLLTNRTAGERLQVTSATESLFQAVDNAGLASAFNSPDNVWTTFAPENEAFENADLSGFSDSEIQEILQYHTLDGVTDSGALLQLLADNGGEVSVPTNQGEDVTVTEQGDGSVVFNGGQATLNLDRVDQRASNGIIHQIDGLLIPPSLAEPTVAGIVANNDDFSTLNTALDATGLDATLDDRAATFTAFAPADASFAPYNVDFLIDNPMLLEEVLGFHVVQGAAAFADDLSDGDTFTTVQGDDVEITIDGGNIFVEGAQVTTADVEAANGVVHVVDDVLLTNRDAVERATVTSDFSILADLVDTANLADALSGPGPDGEDGITVFAPTNQAFLEALDANDNGEIDDSEIPSNAADILKYHVLDDVFFAADVPTTETALPTLEGSDATVVRSGSDVAINPNSENASVIAPDVEASNGVIHGIDTVLQIP
ncbi:MAG: fasciclin domain-containing protein [Salinibacter sp.]|uniref:fasciclin domain-containing protein n=1 Tax=Salinibacter sp. TaxID=2065818 RepID=UPI002FC30A9A